MAKIGVIGDRDSVLLFKAVGLDVFFEDDGAHANRTLHRLAREGYAAVFFRRPERHGVNRRLHGNAGKIPPQRGHGVVVVLHGADVIGHDHADIVVDIALRL